MNFEWTDGSEIRVHIANGETVISANREGSRKRGHRDDIQRDYSHSRKQVEPPQYLQCPVLFGRLASYKEEHEAEESQQDRYRGKRSGMRG